MKLKNIGKILLGIIVLLLAAFFFVKFKQPKIIYKDNLTIQLSREAYNLDFIKEVKNGEIITQKEKIDTNKVGKQTIEIEVKNIFKQTKKYSFEIEVLADENPIISGPEKLETTEGTEIDLYKDVTAKDINGENINLSIEGTYDFNKEGSYELTYIAKDSKGNESKKTIILEVKKKAELPNQEEIKENQKQEKTQNKTEPTSEPTKQNDDGTFTTSKGFKGETKNGITYIDGLLIANKTYSLPSTYSPNGLTQETLNAANEMFAAAKLEGLNMYVQSGFRSYSTQEKLYNNYAARDGKAAADRYSARPGHSEHQSGLGFDVCQNGNPNACINSNFDNTAHAKWLANNAYKYGLILRYPKGKENETGYMYESWHFRYVGKELAAKLYNNGDWITLETYLGITSEYNY